MNNGLRKAAVIGLSACLALASLSGCSKKDEFNAEAAAVTVNGDEISAGLVKFGAHYSQALMEDLYTMYMGVSDPMSQDLYGNGSTLGDMVKSDVVSSLENMVLAEQKMGDYGVELTDEEKASVTEAATQFMSDNGEEVLERMGATQEIVERYLTLRLIQTKMQPAMSADVDTEVSDDEAAQRKIQYTLFRAETEAETEASSEETTEAEESESSSEETTEGAEDEASSEVETEAETVPETEAETADLTEKETVKTGAAAETETEEAAEAATEEGSEAETAEAATEAGSEEESSEAATEAEETETETEDPAMAAAMEEARAKAEAMIEKVKAGADFETASAEVDENATCSTMTLGSDSTSVVEGLVTSTEGLEDGTLVEEPIEASSGYYVAQVISKLDREATDEKKEEIVEQRKSDRISELYTEWRDSGEITQNDEVLAKIVFDFTLSQETEAATEAATEAGSEAATEAGSEADSEAATEAETEAGSEAVTEAETETKTEAVTEAETETKTEAVTEEETDAVTGSETETEK